MIYHPRTPQEAVNLRKEHADTAVYLAGGTDDLRLGGAAEGKDQLERDADAGKMLERKAAVRAVRVDHGAGGGQRVLTFVVIGDDEVDAEGGGKGGLLHAGDAAVHGDDERDALLGKRADRIAAEAVALLDAAGNVHEHRRPAGAEIIGQKAGGGDAVHVVIAEHGDGLAAG